MQKWILPLLGLAILFFVYDITSAIVTQQTTGTLKVVSSDQKANLTISQTNRQAKIIGVGKATVRLAPGFYSVSAGGNGYQATTAVEITKKQTVDETLRLVAAAEAPASAGIFNLLPFEGPNADYEITSSIATSGSVSGSVIVITSSTVKAQQAAINWIRSEGYNPADYQIEYQTQTIENYHYTEGMP